MRERFGTVEHQLVALHVVDPLRRKPVDPIDSGVDLDLPNIREGSHDRGVILQIVQMPCIRIFRRPGIVDEVAARSAVTRRIPGDVDGKRSRHHHLVGDLQSVETRQAASRGELGENAAARRGHLAGE